MITLRTLNYRNYGIFLIMRNAGFVSSTVVAQRVQIGYCSTLITVEESS